MNIIYDNKDNIIKEEHINNIIKMTENEKPNIIQNLPLNKKLYKEYNKIYINKKVIEENEYKKEFINKMNINNIEFELVDNIELDDNSICRINTKELTMPIYFRNRKEGDYIILKGSNNKKKIKEIFIEKKIPKDIRETYPLLVDSNDNIIWIPNIKKSKYCIKKDEKNKNYDIIIKCKEREENND